MSMALWHVFNLEADCSHNTFAICTVECLQVYNTFFLLLDDVTKLQEILVCNVH